MPLDETPENKGMNNKVTIKYLDAYGNVVGNVQSDAEGGFFTAENPSPVAPDWYFPSSKFTWEAKFTEVNPDVAKIITGDYPSASILEAVQQAKIHYQANSYQKQAAYYQKYLHKQYPVPVQGYGETNMPKTKKDYVVGDRVEAVRQFGNTGIFEGHAGTITAINLEDSYRPLIVQWDNHAKSHEKTWTYPYKDVRPGKFVPGEPTEYSLF